MHTHIVLKPYCKWIKTISLAEGKKVSLLIQFDIIPLSEQTNGNFISYVRMHTRCLFIFIWNLAVPLPPHHPAYICVRCKVSPIHKLSILETANSIRICQKEEFSAYVNVERVLPAGGWVSWATERMARTNVLVDEYSVDWTINFGINFIDRNW